MHVNMLNDRISRGNGSAARVIGDWCDVYRPRGIADPLDGRNHVLRFRAAFLPRDGRTRAPVSYGHVTWQGLFDTAYTLPGDYIVRQLSRPVIRDAAIWFVAAQQSLLPPLCVQTSALVTVVRMRASTTTGAAGYGGGGALTSVSVLTGWPASISLSTGAGLNPLDLPASVSPGSWEVLLPNNADLVVRTNDRITDDMGRSAIVTAAELTNLGWRVLAKEIAT